MRHSVAAALAGVCALALATPIALLGRAVLATPAEVARQSRDWPSGARVVRGNGLADRAARSLLGVDSPGRLPEIARAYRRAAAAPAVSDTSATALRLAELAQHLGSAAARSQAHVLAGAVFALPAGNGGLAFAAVRRLGGAASLSQAAQEFRAAIAADGRNEAAKYDLELLLKDEARSQAKEHRHRKPSKQESRKRQHTPSRKHNKQRAPAKRRHQGGLYSNGSGY